MSNIIAHIDNEELVIEKIRARQTENDIEKISIEKLIYNKEYKSNILVTNNKDENKVLLCKELKENDEENNLKGTKTIILVFTRGRKIYYIYGENSIVYKKLVKLKYKVFNLKLGRRYINLLVLGYIINKYDMKIDEQEIHITDSLYKKTKLKEYNKNLRKIYKLLKNRITRYKFKMKDFINDNSKINNNIYFKLKVNGVDLVYHIGKKNKKIKNRRMYYVPLKTIYCKNLAIHIRRTSSGKLVIIKRFREDIENTIRFKFFENRFISSLFYIVEELSKRICRKKVNLYYEKFSSKAEEGVYELCKKTNSPNNYFIIDKDSEFYDKIKKDKSVIRKYSFKYYRLLYRANNLITTEAPMHINILRSNNKYLRKSIYKKQFIFLQHGIIFMKNLGTNSTFVKNREAEPNYMIVSSEAEKDVVTDMLKIDEDRLLNTGLAIFSKIEYKHITDNSDDLVTIMLTWKPYEEYLYNFQESSYYKNTLNLLNLFSKYLPREKIAIIPHPKVKDLLMRTDLKNAIYTGSISKILEKTKLLVTDYSSICYNAFYQGAGIIFFQEDIKIYEKENGKLIPNENEYIGKRTFSIKELDNTLEECIKNGKINMSKIRTEQHEKIYKNINEFSDGKNIERIYQKLKELNII